MNDRTVPRRVDVNVHPDVMLDHMRGGDRLRDATAKQARLRHDDIGALEVVRKSIDARRGKVRLRLAVDVWPPGATARPVAHDPVSLPTLRGAPEVVVVGAGPAGLFCAWALACRGVRSVVLERGKQVRPRRRDLAELVRHGRLDPDSNYCFGEGGAGTFSDGKLYTRADKRGEVRRVLEAFVAYGASPEILVDARPHIGTNRLPGVITRMREHLENAGVEIAFETRADGLQVEGDRVTGVRLADGRTIECRAVVIAPGHSARDVFSWVAAAGTPVRFKPFAIGVRIEHPQSFIDRLQLGALAGHPALGAASYRLVEQACGVGVFSFCMCPGGFIAPAATEPGGQVVNGWSPSSRTGRFANSGFVTEVGPEQLAHAGLDPNDPFAGIAHQRALEQRAYAEGGGDYVAPAQRLDDFVARRPSNELPPCSYPRGLRSARLDAVLGQLGDPLREALQHIERRMPGFVSDHAVAVALESRTSCPVRVERDRETRAALGLVNLYPVGEGTGHAGGIMSAALDGLTSAEHLTAALAHTR
jgi:uncharacterized protein